MADDFRERLHIRIARLRVLFSRATRNPDLLGKAVEEAVEASSYDPPAQLRDPLEHALGGAKRTVQDAYEEMRRGLFGGLTLLVLRLRIRAERYSSSLGADAPLGAGSLSALLMAASAAVFMVLGGAFAPEIATDRVHETAKTASAATVPIIGAPSSELLTGTVSPEDVADFSTSITTAGLVPSSPPAARASARLGSHDDQIQFGRDVVLRFGDEDYPIWSGSLVTVSCRPATTARTAACTAYQAAEPTLQRAGGG